MDFFRHFLSDVRAAVGEIVSSVRRGEWGSALDEAVYLLIVFGGLAALVLLVRSRAGGYVPLGDITTQSAPWLKWLVGLWSYDKGREIVL